jgi:hypothetical protein
MLPSYLAQGHRIKLLQQVPLMPDPDPLPEYIWENIAKAMKIEGTVDILQTRYIGSTPWLEVAGFTPTGEKFSGWINTIALLGSDKFKLIARPLPV